MNPQMNQMSGEQKPNFTPKEGQYLALNSQNLCAEVLGPEPNNFAAVARQY